MGTGPLQAKLFSDGNYLVTALNGDGKIVAVVVNPEYHALFKAAPAMLAALEALRQRYCTVSEAGAIEAAIDTPLYNQIERAIAEAKGQ